MRLRFPVRSRVVSYLWRRWRDQITPAGKVLVGGVCLAAVGGVSVELPIYQVFCALCLVLGLAEITGVFCYPFVELTAEFPDRAVVGEPVCGAVTVRNRSRWRPIFDLSVGFMGLPRSVEQLDADHTVRFLGPGESVRLTVTVRIARRGLCELPPLRAFSTFPFNLVRTGQRRLRVKPVLVLPAFHSLTRVDVPLRSLYQPGGAALTAKVGESLEYVGNREYVPGEPARRLDFRSWARLGRPVVREYQEEYFVRVALVVDTHVPRRERRDRFGDSPRLEAAISLAASIADALSRGENLIDVLGAGREVQFLQAGRHRAPLEQILENLACLEPTRDDPTELLHASLAEHWRSLSTMICVFLQANPARRNLVQAALEAGCSVKVILIESDRRDRQAEEELAALPGIELTLLRPEQILAGTMHEL